MKHSILYLLVAFIIDSAPCFVGTLVAIYLARFLGWIQ